MNFFVILALLNVVLGFPLVLCAANECCSTTKPYLNPLYWHKMILKDTNMGIVMGSFWCVLITLLTAGYMVFVAAGDCLLFLCSMFGKFVDFCEKKVDK